jgi:hypothetical protein
VGCFDAVNELTRSSTDNCKLNNDHTMCMLSLLTSDGFVCLSVEAGETGHRSEKLQVKFNQREYPAGA